MHQIRYFIGVSRTLNFSRAAEECNVSQPALTRAIKLLEDELGGELIRRERNQSHLTDLGNRMLPLLQQCYDAALGAKSLASHIATGEISTLRIALSRTVDLALLLPFLSELMRAMNGLQFKFIRGTTDEIHEVLKAGDADLALAGPMTATWDRLDIRTLFTEPLVLVLPDKHRLADKSSVTLDALLREHFLVRSYCEACEAVANRLRSEGISGSNSHEVASERDLMALLQSGMGVAFLPKSTSVALGLKRCAVADLNVSRSINLYTVAGRHRTQAANTLMKQLLSANWDAVLA